MGRGFSNSWPCPDSHDVITPSPRPQCTSAALTKHHGPLSRCVPRSKGGGPGTTWPLPVCEDATWSVKHAWPHRHEQCRPTTLGNHQRTHLQLQTCAHAWRLHCAGPHTLQCACVFVRVGAFCACGSCAQDCCTAPGARLASRSCRAARITSIFLLRLTQSAADPAPSASSISPRDMAGALSSSSPLSPMAGYG